MSVTIQLDLPDALVEEARKSGLLESKRLAELLHQELRRQRARKASGRTPQEVPFLPGQWRTTEQIQAEIEAARAQRRRRIMEGD
jgi:hypothetical protein